MYIHKSWICIFDLFLSISISIYLSKQRHLTHQNRLKTHSFTLWTCKCASRHKGVHFSDIRTTIGIWTSINGPNMWCSVHFHF